MWAFDFCFKTFFFSLFGDYHIIVCRMSCTVKVLRTLPSLWMVAILHKVQEAFRRLHDNGPLAKVLIPTKKWSTQVVLSKFLSRKSKKNFWEWPGSHWWTLSEQFQNSSSKASLGHPLHTAAWAKENSSVAHIRGRTGCSKGTKRAWNRFTCSHWEQSVSAFRANSQMTCDVGRNHIHFGIRDLSNVLHHSWSKNLGQDP